MQKGIIETTVGYANGQTKNPTYEQVCHENTGHAETVKVVYDVNILSLEELLSIFFEIIDPTFVNKQGPDIGSQYRTGIYYLDKEERGVISVALRQLQKQYDGPIVVEVKELENFDDAEQYHQKYLDKNPNGYCHIPSSYFK